MEVERINQVTRGLRVERSNSDARRRRQHPGNDFSEFLEHSLDEENEHENRENPEHSPADTVSISGGTKSSLSQEDTVTISSAAKVGAQSFQARNGALQLSLVQQLVLGLRSNLELKEPVEHTAPPAEEKLTVSHLPLDKVV
jgi:hypothetical protein